MADLMWRPSSLKMKGFLSVALCAVIAPAHASLESLAYASSTQVPVIVLASHHEAGHGHGRDGKDGVSAQNYEQQPCMHASCVEYGPDHPAIKKTVEERKDGQEE